MIQSSARAVALRALRQWQKRAGRADDIIGKLFSGTKLSPPDRAFALELFYGALRNLTLLDFWLRCLRRAYIDADLRDILRLGFYQLLVLKTPEHAAVNETVDLARRTKRQVVNAILRAAIDQRQQLEERAKQQPLHVRWSHPEFLLKRWQNAFGDGPVVKLCDWNNRPPPVYARINRLKILPADFIQLYPALLLPKRDNFVALSAGITQATAAGHGYIQDPSTAIACELLNARPGDNVLDACAAPGGKTAYLAELMENTGSIVACDRAWERLRVLEGNLRALGVKTVRTVAHDWSDRKTPAQIAEQAPFDRILLDAPCTNTGVMRRRVDVRWRLAPRDFARMHERQLNIARAVLPLLKPGGVFVYSTCSLETEENEAVVGRLLKEMSILQMDDEKRSLPFRDGFDGAYAARLIRAG